MIHVGYKVPNGKLIEIDFEITEDKKFKNVQISGDFFLEPPEFLDIINNKLNGLPISSNELDIKYVIEKSIDENVEMFGFSPVDIAIAIKRAII
ncbi:biotin--protein ligase [Candidatus Kinetoplastidibacterium stringomonadis]|uniref:biotin--protein ligase n=1 Tax=Candidatus Kinetoplastidibacterium stringomonadis TaxID=994696 RepID=UPI0004B4E3E6|nr:biotin--protein ligase [Candidatus Kinetoplastibacterium oncopeltii]